MLSAIPKCVESLTLSFHGLLELSLQDLVLIFTEVLIDLLRFVMILNWLQEKLLNKIPVNQTDVFIFWKRRR